MKIKKIKNEAKKTQQFLNNLDCLGLYYRNYDIKKRNKTCQFDIHFSLKRFLKLFYKFNEKFYFRINNVEGCTINFKKNKNRIYNGITKNNLEYYLYFNITKKIKAFAIINSIYDYKYLKFWDKAHLTKKEVNIK